MPLTFLSVRDCSERVFANNPIISFPNRILGFTRSGTGGRSCNRGFDVWVSSLLFASAQLTNRNLRNLSRKIRTVIGVTGPEMAYYGRITGKALSETLVIVARRDDINMTENAKEGVSASKSPRRVLYYGISFLLVVAYVAVAGLALNPDVSPEYRQYYVEGNVESWPGENGLDYEPGTRLYFGANASNETVELEHRGKGWSAKESWGAWSRGTEAHLVFILDDRPSSGLNLSVNATGFAENDTQIADVVVNGDRLTSMRVSTEGIDTYRLLIPERFLETTRNGDGLLHVVFRIRNPVSPKELGVNDDSRRLGLGVQWIELERTNRTTREGRTD